LQYHEETLPQHHHGQPGHHPDLPVPQKVPLQQQQYLQDLSQHYHHLKLVPLPHYYKQLEL
jgi:hypothetical protein